MRVHGSEIKNDGGCCSYVGGTKWHEERSGGRQEDSELGTHGNPIRYLGLNIVLGS